MSYTMVQVFHLNDHFSKFLIFFKIFANSFKKTLCLKKSTNDSKVISYVLRGHINPSWHLKMCTKLSLAFLLQKGQKVLPSYFSVKFVLMSFRGKLYFLHKNVI